MSTQPVPISTRVAREVRSLMANHEPRLVSRDLADTLGISQQSASRRMKGETPISLKELWEISTWLGVPLTRLTDEPATASR